MPSPAQSLKPASREERQPASPSKGTVIFFHPDLGIGGAERLVVDAAVGLQQRGHRVVLFTNHCDPGHCFDECRDGTLDVRVRVNRLIPPSIFSRLTILCAILRHILLLIQITLTGELAALRPTAFFVDQLSAGLPLLRYISPRVPVLFYCHFPDLLLARGREGALKSLYRLPFDMLEEWTMGFSQAVAVNSNFTRGIVAGTWPRLQRHVTTRVIYPCVPTAISDPGEDDLRVLEGEIVVLSINRFERKKDIGLAIKAFAAVPADQRKGVRLVLAGGHDPRIVENVECHAELEVLASSLGLTHHTTRSLQTGDVPSCDTCSVLFLLSVSNEVKTALLHSARLLVYTPSNEHFGIVPLEAMLAHVPVLAANTGGPVETVVDGTTGWLRAPDDVNAWSETMSRALKLQPNELARMGSDGADRVHAMFGRDNMALHLEETLAEIAEHKIEPSVLARLVILSTFFIFGLTISTAFATIRGGSK